MEVNNTNLDLRGHYGKLNQEWYQMTDILLAAIGLIISLYQRVSVIVDSHGPAPVFIVA